MPGCTTSRRSPKSNTACLARRTEASDGRPLQSAQQPATGDTPQHVVVGKGDIVERATHESRAQLSHDGFDLGQLRHACPQTT